MFILIIFMNPLISREFENIFNFIVKSQKKYTKIRVTNDEFMKFLLSMDYKIK